MIQVEGNRIHQCSNRVQSFRTELTYSWGSCKRLTQKVSCTAAFLSKTAKALDASFPIMQLDNVVH